MALKEDIQRTSRNDPLAPVRAAAEAVLRNDVYIPGRWPGTYAADFLRNHPEVVPGSIRAQRAVNSRADASAVLGLWAEQLGVPRTRLAAVFADAYLVEWRIPLERAAAQRAAVEEVDTTTGELDTPPPGANELGERGRPEQIRREVMSRIRRPEQTYSPAAWPYAYAATFIRSHNVMLPPEVLARFPNGMVTSLQAADALTLWAQFCGVPREDLARILADACLTERGIPLKVTYAQRSDVVLEDPYHRLLEQNS